MTTVVKSGVQITLALGWALALSGCQPPDTRLMPLRSGLHWAYVVQNARQSLVGEVSVIRPVAVGDVSGWELQAPSGISRIAWDRGTLQASMLSGTRYSPPIPLLVADPVGKTINWKGQVSTPMHNYTANATMTWQKQDLQLGGKTFHTVREDCQIKLESGSILTLTTWFSPEVGIVRQDQRTNGIQVLALEHLSGP